MPCKVRAESERKEGEIQRKREGDEHGSTFVWTTMKELEEIVRNLSSISIPSMPPPSPVSNCCCLRASPLAATTATTVLPHVGAALSSLPIAPSSPMPSPPPHHWMRVRSSAAMTSSTSIDRITISTSVATWIEF
ncbi:Os12g0565450 [Oryza sativa Japonica Group]|uniref:Os12g0565450 protein n=1 Tax=Oryza sativa subsp. japonica TaxID=39947 RepID=C7J9V4_ORYSJ|nr:Os12g0565450 [Oryza sativa Japonica Group]|eukprot:NP_001177010.1 Os12g0565450 [Oryza sativa Japonica Group]